jgi:hypothetical protein
LSEWIECGRPNNPITLIKAATTSSDVPNLDPKSCINPVHSSIKTINLVKPVYAHGDIGPV